MKNTSDPQRLKAMAMAEEGLGKITPHVKVKKTNSDRERSLQAAERPIGLKKGGVVKKPVKKMAEGGAAKIRKGQMTAKGAPIKQSRGRSPAYE